MNSIVNALQERYPTCPNCGRKIGLFNRIEKCAYSGDLVCNKCIVSGRFSDKWVDKIPAEYREKFRFFNVLPFLVIVTVMFSLVSTAWYYHVDWNFSDLNATLNGLLTYLGIAFGSLIILGIVLGRLPHLGTWIFYWWIVKPEHREEVTRAVAAKDAGTYQSTDRLYAVKIKAFTWFKGPGKHILYWTSIGLTGAMIPLFFIVRNLPVLAGSVFSAIVGGVYIASLVVNVLVILTAAGFYCQQTPENREQKRVVEGLSWSYAILMPLVFVSFILGWVADYGGLIDALPPTIYEPMMVTHQVAFVAQSVVMVLLAYYLHVRGTPQAQYDINANAYRDDRPNPLKQILKGFGTLIALLCLLVVAVLALEIAILDFAMAICVLASTYLLLGLAFPVILITIKLLNRTPKRYSQLFWKVTKISAVSAAILCVPLVGTVVWTNTNVDAQFIRHFGRDWQAQIPEDLRAKMAQVSFSAFDAFFGYQLEYGAAKFNEVYGWDSPRYVKEKDVIYANGSESFPNVTHPMLFDVYLPPGVQFGEGTNRFPVIVFFHGVGQEKGAENANLTSIYLANQGYVVCDMMYGYNDWADLQNKTSGRMKGYDFPDTIRHIGMFTHYLEAHQDFYHADLTNVYFSGRSYGGWMTAVCAYGYNLPFFGTNFSSAITVRGALPYYGAHGIPSAGEFLSNDLITDVPIIRGSPDPEDPEYNPEFVYYDPYQLATREIRGDVPLPPTLFFHGTNDYIVPVGWSRRLAITLQANGGTTIEAYYPLGSHGFDALHWSQYGQSVLYYFERFLALTRADL